MKIDNVLSLFDGISCGQMALNKIGIKYEKYYASEIDKQSINLTQYNFPNTIQMGDVKKIDGKMFPYIYLLIGGSPCQGFSFSGKNLNFDDPRSKLFFEYYRLLKETKPKYFLLENVKMQKKYQDIISEFLGVQPIEINSRLVSGQNRVRLYWTNIPNVTQPEDENINFYDILEDHEINSIKYDKYSLNNGAIIGRRLNSKNRREDFNKDIPINQCIEVRKNGNEKSNCLTTINKDNVVTPLGVGRHRDAYKKNLPFRYLTTSESCKLQTIPYHYFDNDVVSESVKRKLIGNAWTVDVISHILSFLKK